MAKFKEIARYDIALKDIVNNVLDALEVSGALIEASAKFLCPVDLGELKGSINHQVDENELCVRVGTNVEYAPYVEFGTGEYAENGQGRKGGWFYVTDRPVVAGWLRPLGITKDGKYLYFTYGSKPQPYLRPALLENKGNIDRIFKEKFK